MLPGFLFTLTYCTLTDPVVCAALCTPVLVTAPGRVFAVCSGACTDSVMKQLLARGMSSICKSMCYTVKYSAFHLQITATNPLAYSL